MLFGNDRMLVHPKRFGRDSVAAIQDAVVDWMLLGVCSKLYCSFYSSFSETAIAVSKAPANLNTREWFCPLISGKVIGPTFAFPIHFPKHATIQEISFSRRRKTTSILMTSGGYRTTINGIA